ncbi:MAG: FAD:protein FMN transferase [Planctomycetia bacterium]|nr:FAD:protein FMN transferase [Planctomycetia bacterium]
MFRSLLRWIFLLIPVLLLTQASGAEELKRFDYTAQKMGIPLSFALYAPSEKAASDAVDLVLVKFDEINQKMSDYTPESEVIQACRTSEQTGNFVPISSDLYQVLEKARQFNTRTEGAFDVAVSPLVKLWRRSRSFHQLPPKAYLDEAKKLTGNSNWELDPQKGVRLLKKGVRFDLGGIAKGYVLDQALLVFQKTGITSVLINAGGDMRIGNPPPGEKGWKVGFASLEKDAAPVLFLDLAQCGVATSGDTFRYVEINGIRYSHLIDPRTGEPMRIHRIVSVIAPNAIDADALASAFSILPPEKRIEISRQFPSVDLLIFEQKTQSKEKNLSENDFSIFSTDKFRPYLPKIKKE